MHNYIYEIKRMIVSDRVSDWCLIPYHGHKHGCPNHNKQGRATCPPFAPHVFDYFDSDKPLYFVNSVFDLESHTRRMKRDHFMWSEYQCKCVLYWQNTSRKQLKERVVLQMYNLRLNALTYCPEAMGVNVYATAHFCGLKLDRIRHLKICRHVALIGTKKGRK